jgi:hypothetical protein
MEGRNDLDVIKILALTNLMVLQPKIRLSVHNKNCFYVNQNILFDKISYK